MDTISFEEFSKLSIRVGKITAAEPVEGSDKLMKLIVDFGLSEEGNPHTRQIIAGIAKFYTPEQLIGKECPFAYNLAPKTLKGLQSQGMLLCPSDNGNPVLLHPDKDIMPGSLVK